MVVEGAVIGLKDLSGLGITVTKPFQVVTAKLLWGVFYGLSFGAGLGVVFHLCQEPHRAALAALSDTGTGTALETASDGQPSRN